jgi:BMFP domain-containing protein YqiC
MQSEKTLFDDLVRLATGAAGALGDVKGEVEARVRAQLERVLARMNLPTREEFDAVKALAAAARAEAEALKKRIEQLEGKGVRASAASRSTTKSAPAKSRSKRS